MSISRLQWFLLPENVVVTIPFLCWKYAAFFIFEMIFVGNHWISTAADSHLSGKQFDCAPTCDDVLSTELVYRGCAIQRYCRTCLRRRRFVPGKSGLSRRAVSHSKAIYFENRTNENWVRRPWTDSPKTGSTVHCLHCSARLLVRDLLSEGPQSIIYTLQSLVHVLFGEDRPKWYCVMLRHLCGNCLLNCYRLIWIRVL